MISKMNAGNLVRCSAALAVVLLAATVAPSAPAAMDGITGDTPRHSERRPPPASAPVPSPAPAPRRLKILCVSRSIEGREFLFAVLAAKDIEARVGGPELVPETLKELISYDCVVLSNIPRASLGDAKMRMLVRYVRDYGGGLVVLGGPGSLGPAYRGTPLEEILPVTMAGEGRLGKKEVLPLCIVLLLDKSASMGMRSGKGAGGLVGGVEARRDKSERASSGFASMLGAERASAEELVKQLRPEDMLGIIPFDSSYSVLVPLEPMGDDRKGTIDLIDRIQPGGDTALAKPLEEALRRMEGSSCRVKHVILITDGQAKDLSMYDYRGLISRFARSGVTVSAIGVGSDADNNFLRALAMGTGGDYSHVKDEAALPLAVLRDARKAAVESGFINESVVPKPGEKNSMLKGIRREEIPEVRGYVIMTAKPGTDVALYTDVRGRKDPLLAWWGRVYGKTVVWTSDVEGHWAGGAGSAKESGKFWARVVRWAMRERPGSR